MVVAATINKELLIWQFPNKMMEGVGNFGAAIDARPIQQSAQLVQGNVAEGVKSTGHNISNQILFNMMINIQKSVDSLKGEIIDCKTGLNLKIQNIEQIQNEDDDQILELYEKQEQSDEKVAFLTGVVARQEKIIHSLQGRIIEIDCGCTINNLIITGIPQKEQKNCVMESQHFFRSKLRLDQDMPIKSALRLGKGGNQPMLKFHVKFHEILTRVCVGGGLKTFYTPPKIC